MRRRDFLTLLGGAAAVWPLAARAQPGDRMRRIGVLMSADATDALFQSYLAAFKDGLRQLGWTEGQNLHVDVRWMGGDADAARIYAAQLIGLMPDVILACTTDSLTPVQRATTTVPIVFVQVADPVTQGFVTNVRRPGGNLTGISLLEFSLAGKWLDLLKKAKPALARAALVSSPDPSRFWVEAAQSVAPALRVEVTAIQLRAADDIEPALERFASAPNGGLILLYDNFIRSHHAMIADLARRLDLPSIGSGPDFAKVGGLMDYGPRTALTGQYRQAATYVDRILRGTPPGDLPVQAADKYTFVINLKTAKSLSVPDSLISAADEVIE